MTANKRTIDVELGDLIEFCERYNNFVRFTGIISDVCLTRADVDRVNETRTLNHSVYPEEHGTVYYVFAVNNNSVFKNDAFEVICDDDVTKYGFIVNKI